MPPPSAKRKKIRRPDHKPPGPTGGTKPRDFNVEPRDATIIVGAIAALHTLGLVLLFHPVSGLFADQPIIDQDWGLHFHHLNSLAAFWHQSRMAWGYNPYFMAGYPSNTIQDLSIKFFEWFAVCASGIALSPVQWFKLSAFLATASLPWTIYFAAKNFFAAEPNRHRLALMTAFLATVYWWNSFPREMFFYGVIGFPIASYLSLLGVSIFFRLVRDRVQTPSLISVWLLFAAVIMPLHPESILVFAPPMVALLAFRPRLLTVRVAGWIAAAVSISTLLNLVWLIPAFMHRGDDASTTIVKQLPLFADTGGFAFILDYVGSHGYWSFRPSVFEKGFRLALLLLGTMGIGRLCCDEDKDLGILLASASLLLFGVAYFGALIPAIKPWQPLRFKVPLDLYLAIAAAYRLDRWLSDRVRSRPLVPIILSCGLMAFIMNVVVTESTGRLRLRSQFIPELKSIIAWIRSETPSDARVLFEESGDESGFVYNGTYLSSFLPYFTGRQLIGGPINLYNDRHHFAEFHSGKLFKKDPLEITDAELRNYLRLYNIGAVVAFDPASIQRLQSVPGLVTVEERLGPITLMRVNQPLSWFLAGEGNLKASYNRLELSDLSGNPIILKFHWVDGLTATPYAHVEPIKMADDPIPFIKLIDPPSALTLQIGSANP